jgi:4-aminobutyrate aminotransferase-like enzyme/Ser/Thr protein kinase RdoA (MazF antagonist)
MTTHIASSHLTDAQVRDLIEEHYPVRVATLTSLGGELDQNLLVTDTDGWRYVAKLSSVDADHAAWQAELAARARALPVGDMVATRNHAAVAVFDQDGLTRTLRLGSWLPGRRLADLSRHSAELLQQWGRISAELVLALADAPDGPVVTHHWDALRASEAIIKHHDTVVDPDDRAMIDRIRGWFEDALIRYEDDLPRQVIHHDLNDYNLLAAPGPDGHHRITGIVDFGDALRTARVGELAISMAYAMLRKPDPLATMAHLVTGYSQRLELTDAELAVLYPMAAARLCVNATTWTARAATGAYGQQRMQHTWPALRKLSVLPPDAVEAGLRHALGRSTPKLCPSAVQTAAPAFAVAVTPVNLTAGSDVEQTAAPLVVGSHLTSRRDNLLPRRTDSGEPATVHLGIDLHARETVAASCPLDATVEHVDPTTVVLRHEFDGLTPFWSRWVGITHSLSVGLGLKAGDSLGYIDGILRCCLFTSLESAVLAPADYVSVHAVPAWSGVTVDPSAFLGLAAAPEPEIDRQGVLAARDRHFARSQRAYYDDPPLLVHSDGVWLYDEQGRGYLDVMNNVTHVGHANPAVVAAASRQMRHLNTNSRFVYDGISRYATRLASLLPDPLEVVFLVCTGSEANDLALRIARQVTGREDILVIDGAYHGNTTAVTGISPNRYKGPGGQGAPPTTHEVQQPNGYHGPFGYADPDAGTKYAADVADVVRRLADEGRPPAAFIAEALMGTAGSITLPDGYLAAAFDSVRAAGGLCINDEVQVGFGRMGDAFWGFETQGVVPDIVTVGKPMGNGHPLAAVVTTREIAEAFDSGMKYFNTYGGNPVSCAVGMAVLDEIEQRGLQAHANDVGAYLRRRLDELAERHLLVGDVRGHGLYLGVELVTDRQTRQPAAAEARYISERLKDEGILTYPTGAGDNILKIKPPMPFSREHADLLVDALDAVLTHEW